MQRTQREPFTPDAQFACVKPFVMSGTAYAAGQLVDTGGIEVRRLRQMYESRMINPVARQQQAALLKPAPKREPEPVVAPGARRADHKGFGRWYVIDADGKEIAGPLTKEEAEAQVAAA